MLMNPRCLAVARFLLGYKKALLLHYLDRSFPSDLFSSCGYHHPFNQGAVNQQGYQQLEGLLLKGVPGSQL